MIKLVRRLLPLVLLVGAIAPASAQEFITRPEVPGHPIPTAEFPEPRAGWLEYLDVAVLAGALAWAVPTTSENRP